MMTSRIGLWVLCLIFTPLAGCSTYLRVTDPASGKAYYTTDIDEAGKAGAVKFKDEKSGSVVTLQSSEVKEVSKDEYMAALKTQTPVPPPAPK
jgi:uncharacterized protein YceK